MSYSVYVDALYDSHLDKGGSFQTQLRIGMSGSEYFRFQRDQEEEQSIYPVAWKMGVMVCSKRWGCENGGIAIK